MRYYTYGTINRQCHPQTIALTSNHKFLPPPSLSSPSSPSSSPGCSVQNKNMSAEDLKAVWGAALWKYMHYSAANYPDNPSDQEIKDMKSWLECLATTIPCNNCAKHFKSYIDTYKSKLYDICSSKSTLFEFLVDIHNKVNERLGKPIMTLDEAYAIYGGKKGCQSCSV